MHFLINTCECDMYMKTFIKNWFPYVYIFSFHVVLKLILEKCNLQTGHKQSQTQIVR